MPYGLFLPDVFPGGGNMAFRRSATARYGGFDPSLGRVGRMLIGGEENDFFERMMRGGETCWYVPNAVMWHIIPPGKLTEDYFRRLCYNVGVSQRLRAGIYRRYPKAVVLECMKWAATLLLSLTMSPRKSLWLIRMRYEISPGAFLPCRPLSCALIAYGDFLAEISAKHDVAHVERQ